MDETVREMSKKEGCGCNVESAGAAPACGRMRARGRTGSLRLRVCAFAVTGTGLMRL